MSALSRVAEMLKPDHAELWKFALAETDPMKAERYEPITAGPLVAVAILAVVALSSFILNPWRLLVRIFRIGK